MGYAWIATFILQVFLSFYFGWTCNFSLFFLNLGIFFLALLYSSCFGYFKKYLTWGNFFESRIDVIVIPMFLSLMIVIFSAMTKTAVNEYKIINGEYTASQLSFKEKEYKYTSKWVEYKGMSFDYRQLPNGNFKLTRRLK
jgi:hypothetical protein